MPPFPLPYYLPSSKPTSQSTLIILLSSLVFDKKFTANFADSCVLKLKYFKFTL